MLLQLDAKWSFVSYSFRNIFNIQNKICTIYIIDIKTIILFGPYQRFFLKLNIFTSFSINITHWDKSGVFFQDGSRSGSSFLGSDPDLDNLNIRIRNPNILHQELCSSLGILPLSSFIVKVLVWDGSLLREAAKKSSKMMG